MRRIVQLTCGLCLLLLWVGCPADSRTGHQIKEPERLQVQPAPDEGSRLADELGQQAENIAAETRELELDASADNPLPATEPEDHEVNLTAEELDEAELLSLEDAEGIAGESESTLDQEPQTGDGPTDSSFDLDAPAPPFDTSATMEPETLPEVGPLSKPALPQNTGELFVAPEPEETPIEESGLEQNTGELFELDTVHEDCCTPGLSAAAQELVGYWAIAASVTDRVTHLNDRHDAYAFELDAKGCLVLHIRLEDGRVLNLAGAWDFKDSKFSVVLDADDAETSYQLTWHSENLRVLTARNGTKLYLVRIDPLARPARPASSYQSSTFNISFTGHDGKYTGTFAEGRGILNVAAIGGFLVGSFSRAQADDGVLNGYVILEIQPDRFIGPYWCENCSEFSADWVGER